MNEKPLVLRFSLLSILVAALTYLGRHTEIDDALIYARYIQNALVGKGLVFNAGEHVNALTSPLFAYLLLGTSWLLKGQVLLATTILSGLFLFLAAALAERLCPFSGFLVASTSYFYTLMGMESSLYLFMLVLVVSLYAEHKDDWLPLASILLILTRFEGVGMALLIAIALIGAGRIPRWPSFIPAFSTIGLYLFLNKHWYETAIPNSAMSKIGQGRSGFWGSWPKAFLGGGRQLLPDFLPIFYIVLLVAFGVFLGFKRGWHKPVDRILAGFCILTFAFYFVLNIPGYRWYFAPIVFIAMILASQSIPKHVAYQRASVAVVVLASVTSAHTLYRLSYDPHGGYYGLAEWINQNTTPASRIEASEIGIIGWSCPNRYLIDIIGLTTPKNAVHVAHGDDHSWLAEDKPDYIIVHDMPWRWENIAKHDPDYAPVGVHFGTAYVLGRRTNNQ